MIKLVFEMMDAGRRAADDGIVAAKTNGVRRVKGHSSWLRGNPRDRGRLIVDVGLACEVAPLAQNDAHSSAVPKRHDNIRPTIPVKLGNGQRCRDLWKRE